MAELEQDFNVAEAPVRGNFEHLQPGDYVCIMTRFSESTKVGEELVRIMEHDIQEGESAGRKIFDRLNFGADAEWKINNCYAAIAEIAKAVGVDKVKKDMSNIMNKRFIARVVVNPDKKNPNKLYNNITEYLPYKVSSSNGTGSTPKTQAAPAASVTVESKSAPPADQSALPPWKRTKSS